MANWLRSMIVRMNAWIFVLDERVKLRQRQSDLKNRLKDRIDRLNARLEGRWLPTTPLGQFFFFLAQTFLSYYFLCANTRAIAADSYYGAVITDGFITLQGGIIHKFTVEDKNGRTWFAIAGSFFGGLLGSCASIWVNKHIYRR